MIWAESMFPGAEWQRCLDEAEHVYLRRRDAGFYSFAMVILSHSSVKVAFAIFGATLFLGQTIVLGEDQITNASYDVSREFYQEVNQAFGKIWKTKTGRDVRIPGSVRSDLYSGTVDLVHRRTS